jgi:hypothetical protein
MNLSVTIYPWIGSTFNGELSPLYIEPWSSWPIYIYRHLNIFQLGLLILIVLIYKRILLDCIYDIFSSILTIKGFYKKPPECKDIDPSATDTLAVGATNSFPRRNRL